MTNIEHNVIVIAEAGVNHNGDLSVAKKLIEVAAEAGADYVKFQTFKSSNVVSVYAPKATYQKINAPEEGNSQIEMIRKYELDVAAHIELVDYCKRCNIKFLSTAFDLESVDFLASLSLDYWKIPSGEITNYPYLSKIGAFNNKVILSTGMSTQREVEETLNVLIAAGTMRENITLLHCNTQYPTPFEDVNLNSMLTLKNAFKLNVGYSDHTLGIEVPIAAVALGASIIEKHFTLNRNMEGPDHKASLEPHELRTMIQSIRHIEKAMGDGVKRVSNSERENLVVARKSIVAKQNIVCGEVFSEENITVKRPGTGISPMLWNDVIGQIAANDFQPDDLIVL
jgi:N,N'-diacetyllegionaminate synthase